MNDKTLPSTATKSDENHEASLMPPVDVVEDNAGITLYADLPGVTREALHIRVEDETLFIEGDLGLKIPEGMESIHAEVSSARYRRLFRLSKELDTDKVSAELKQGVLKLRIPKAEHAQPKRIQVSVG